MRRAARVDANQGTIVSEYRRLGCSVRSTAALGKGFPDLCVGIGGLSALVEVKDGSKPPSARALTPDERDFRDTWTGGVYLVEKVEDVARHVETLRRWHSAIVMDRMAELAHA